jgi:hypothetical protein
MKVRQGFVSNSSSSSFICVIAKVIDPAKLETFLDKNKNCFSSHCKQIYLGSEIPDAVRDDVCDFDDRMYINPSDYQENAQYLVLSEIGDEGDSYFTDDPDGWDLNYDIDFDFFDGFWHDLVDKAEENGIQIMENTYYAGRNG